MSKEFKIGLKYWECWLHGTCGTGDLACLECEKLPKEPRLVKILSIDKETNTITVGFDDEKETLLDELTRLGQEMGDYDKP